MATAMQEPGLATAPAPYDGFDKVLVDGTWRAGGGDRVVEDRDPYTNDVLVRIPAAGERDLDEAYRAADAAQAAWAARRPSERSGVLRRALPSWRPGARRSSTGSSASRAAPGSRRISSGRFTRAMTLEAATFPSRSEGQILPDRHRRQGEPRLPPAGRRGRHDQPVELPASPQQPVHRPRAGTGQRGRDQAGVGHAGDRRAAPGQDLRGGGSAARRAQRGGRPVAARSATSSCCTRCRG